MIALDSAAPSKLSLPGLDPALLTAALGPRFTLLWGSNTPTRTLLAMLTVLAARGEHVRIFDGGNCFDGYFVARFARQLSHHPYRILNRVRLSRAFTCFQLAELIENTAAESQPGGADPISPLFVLDLLSTFYDESVSLPDVERLLGNTIAHLKLLAQSGPVIVGAREPQSLVKDRWGLLDQLQLAADSAWMLRSPEGLRVEQPSLF